MTPAWLPLAAAAGVLAAAGLARRGAPVGHFTSAAGHDAFVDAYERAMRDLPAPDATLDVRTGYGVVRVYRFDGAQPERAPLVLLPGRASASPVWTDNLAYLRAIRTVYTVDLLGEPGASVQQRPLTDDEDQAEWLDQVLQRLPEPTFNVVGLSIGGWTAVNLAIRRPRQLASITLLDPVVTFSDLPLGAVLRSVAASIRWLPRSGREAFASWTAGGAPARDVPVAEMIGAAMRHYALRLPPPSRFTEHDLAGLGAVPVLAIIAGRSVMHDDDAAERVARATLRTGTVLVYPDASHALNGEYPREIADELARFLAAHQR